MAQCVLFGEILVGGRSPQLLSRQALLHVRTTAADMSAPGASIPIKLLTNQYDKDNDKWMSAPGVFILIQLLINPKTKEALKTDSHCLL